MAPEPPMSLGFGEDRAITLPVRPGAQHAIWGSLARERTAALVERAHLLGFFVRR